MRRIYLIAISLLGIGLNVSAQEEHTVESTFKNDHIVERTFVVTDRLAYVAGDDVWCSAFCIDVTDEGRLSDFSKVAYVELISAENMVANCKIALENGRGAGNFRIPVSTPSGTYRIFAYTALNRNEVGMDYLEASGLIYVYNTLSTAKTGRIASTTAHESAPHESAPHESAPHESAPHGSAPQGSTAQESAPQGSTEQRLAATGGAQAGPVKMLVEEDGSITLTNGGDRAVTASLSVFNADAVASAASSNAKSYDIKDFAASFADGLGDVSFEKVTIPEYDGEIIYAKVPEMFATSSAFISSPGDKTNIYTSAVDANGLLTFFTGNIFGERNMVFQLDDERAKDGYALDVVSPFVEVAADVEMFPVLPFSEEMRPDLERRSVSMQLGDKFGTEILLDRIPFRPDLLFSEKKIITYKLEDYTRFPTFREVLTEYVKQASVRGRGEKEQIHVMDSGMSLVMLDGVPVTEHSIVLSLDPNLVKKMEIYPYSVATGNRVFDGIINFVTLKGDMASVKLPDNARVLDFKGSCYPMSLSGNRIDESYPDYRQTLLWQPVVELKAGESISFKVVKPAYKSAFKAVLSGMTEDGRAFLCSESYL